VRESSIPQDVSRAWYRQCRSHPDPAKAVLAALAVHDDPKLLRHYLLTLRRTQPELFSVASDRHRYDTLVAVYTKRYRPAQTGSNTLGSSPSEGRAEGYAGAAVDDAGASTNLANIRLVRRLLGALFTSDPNRTLKPRAATLLTVVVLDQARSNRALRRDWTGLWLGAGDCALRVGCGRAAATADLSALVEVGALKAVTAPRPGVVTRYRQGRISGPASAAADALRPVTAALVDGAVEPVLAEVIGSAGHLIWSWTPHGHDALWVLAADAWAELTGLGPGGRAALSGPRRRRARRWLDARGLTLGSWEPGGLGDALDGATPDDAREDHGRAVEARAEAVATRRGAVAEAQVARSSVGELLAVVGAVPVGGAGADQAVAAAWMTAMKAARSWGTGADRTDLARRLRRQGWCDHAGAAANLLPSVVEALEALAGPIPPGDADEAERRAWLMAARGAGVCGEVAREELAEALRGTAGWTDGVSRGAAFAVPVVEQQAQVG